MNLLVLFLTLFTISCAQKSKSGYDGHGASSISPKLLKKFAPKPLAAEKLKHIEGMLDIQSPGMGVLSPDGQNIYFSWAITGTRQIWKASKAFKFPVQLTSGQERTNLNSITPDGKYLILSQDVKGNEYPKLYIQPTNGGKLQLIAGKSKVITSYQFTSQDSKHLYFTMNDTAPTQHNLYKVNLQSRKITKVLDGIKGYMFIADTKSNGDLLIGNSKGNTATEFFLYNIKSKKLTPVLGQDENESYYMLFSRKSKEYIVRTNKFGEYHRLYKYRNEKFTPITNDQNYNVGYPSTDRNKTRLIYTINKKGYTKVKAISLKNYKGINLTFLNDPDALHTYSGSTTPNSRYTIFGISKAQSPSTSYVYDWVKQQKTQWLKPSTPEINTKRFIKPKLLSYPATDGTTIPMIVHRPTMCIKNKTNCPVIVNFHGGPESQARPRFSIFIQLFIDAGFIYVQPNVRGSSGYSKSWLNSDNGPKRLNVISDIKDVAEFIKKDWAVNGQPPKIGVMGGSYGGYATNIAMTMFAGTYSAGVSIVGMSSLTSFLKNTGSFRRHLRTSEYGDPAKDLEVLERLSPINYLHKLQDPLLIIHGATDPRVPAGEAIQIYNAMEAKGLDGELILFADEGHGIRKRKNKSLYIGHTLEFFKKHLLP